MPDRIVLRVDDLFKDYEGGLVKALRGVSMEIREGEIVGLMGPSGCGKTTLLSLIGILDRPTAGRIFVDGKDLREIRNAFQYRACSVGFVFQFHHLIPAMTLRENVEAPMYARNIGRKERKKRAMEMLAAMDLSSRENFLPSRVSGGERQRAAVARALINEPRLVLADEPTGNLDSANSRLVFDLFLSNARTKGISVVLATHNPEIASMADRLVGMMDGRIYGSREVVGQ